MEGQVTKMIFIFSLIIGILGLSIGVFQLGYNTGKNKRE